MPERKLTLEDAAICHLITKIVSAVVDADEDVRVELLEESEAITLRVHVSDSDLGKVIGKQGRTARSLRTIVSAVGMKHKRRYALDIATANSSWNAE